MAKGQFLKEYWAYVKNGGTLTMQQYGKWKREEDLGLNDNTQ